MIQLFMMKRGKTWKHMDRDIQDPRNVRIDLLYKFFTIVCNNLTFLVISSFVNLRAFCGLSIILP